MTDVAATAADASSLPLDRQLEQYRRELIAHCYRMLGSAFEAEDAVQETMVRAWKAYDSFEGRSSLRSWLYRIATNVCLDMLGSKQRRARPMDFGEPQVAERATLDAAQRGDVDRADPRRPRLPEGDPGEVAAAKESIRLAFIGALQHLPPKQRAVLILREVLRWKAEEVAELLGTTVASVNSALQRARATLGENGIDESEVGAPRSDDESELAAKYADAFERYDIEALTALLHDDAVLSMPPFDLWLQGEAGIVGWLHRSRRRVQGIAADRRRGGQRLAGVGPVPRQPRRRPRPVVPDGARDRATARSRGSTRSSTPTACSRCSACRRHLD